MRIQHNIMAMGSYRNYTNNVSALQKNLERLSSGYKINRAGDDAAGLAISEKMRAQITGLEAAQKNAKDGISLVQTAEGALTEVHDMLNRMVELATMSANGTYNSDTDRTQLQKEVDQLKDEIDRIADSANFNGIQLLDGSMDTTVKVAGEKDLFDGPGKTTGILTAVMDGQLGNATQAGEWELDFTNFKFDVSATATGSVSITIFGVTVVLASAVATDHLTWTGSEIASAFQAAFASAVASEFTASGTYGVTLSAELDGTTKVRIKMDKAPKVTWNVNASITFSSSVKTAYTLSGEAVWPGDNYWDTNIGNGAQGTLLKVIKEPVDSSVERKYATAKLDIAKLAAQLKDGSTLKIGDTTYTIALGLDSKYKDAENVIDLTDITAEDLSGASIKKPIQHKIANRITTAALDNANFKVTSQGAISTAADGVYLYLTEKEGGVDTNDYKLRGATQASTTNSLRDADWSGFVTLGEVDTANMGTALTLQIGDTADSYNQLKVSINDCHVAALGISGVDISSQDGAKVAVDAIKDAINKVSDVRGTLGATQNRLDHTINNLSVMTENIQDAESTIRDTDIAEEMMAYTKNNILIQSAQAMLAQANQVPQGVLQLLG